MKKISRRDFLAASTAVGAAGVLTACGGSSSTAASTAGSAAASSAAGGKSTDYPTKGISVICPWSAGGGTDSCLRAFCEAMGKNLGVMDEERNPVFPDVPTCKEQGYDITYYTQRGMAAPLGVDDAIMTRLEEACAAAIEDPDFVTFMNNNGQAISYLDAQGYADYLKQAAVDVAAAMDAVGL